MIFGIQYVLTNLNISASKKVTNSKTLTYTAWKVSVFGVFLVRIFPHSEWIRRDTPYLSVPVQICEDTNQKNSEYGHLSRSDKGSRKTLSYIAKFGAKHNTNSTALRSGSFSEKKNIKKRHLCRHDKNCYYFCKSNVSAINLIVGFRNMIKVSKNNSF